MIITVLAYILTIFLACYVIGFPVALLAGLFARFFGMGFAPMISILGVIFCWQFVRYGWLQLEGGDLPISILIFVFLWNLVLFATRHKVINDSGKGILMAEGWGALVVLIIILFTTSSIRWV